MVGTLFPKECRICEVYQKLVFKEGGVQKSVLPLIFGCNHFGQYYLFSSFAGQKKQKPRHTGRIRRLCLCSEVAFAATFFSRWRALSLESFRQFFGAAELVQLSALCVRITNTQTVIAFGELWLHSLCNLQVNLRYARLHKPSHLIRKIDGLSAVMLTVPVEF